MTLLPLVGNHGKLGTCPRPWRGGGTAHRITAPCLLRAKCGVLRAWHRKGEGWIRNGALTAVRRSTGSRPGGTDGKRASSRTTTKIISRWSGGYRDKYGCTGTGGGGGGGRERRAPRSQDDQGQRKGSKGVKPGRGPRD